MRQVKYIALTTGKRNELKRNVLEDLCPEDGVGMVPPKVRQAPTRVKYFKL